MKSLYHTLKRFFYSVRGRLVISHIMVGVITIALALIFAFVVAIFEIFGVEPIDYLSYAQNTALNWLVGNESGLPNIKGFDDEGYSLVIAPDEQILFVQGDTLCQIQMMLSECAPEWGDVVKGERFIEIANQQWAEIVVPLASGERALTRRLVLPLNDFFALIVTGLPFLSAYAQMIFVISLIIGILSIPTALLLVWLIVRPFVTRLMQIAKVSNQFADGDLTVRVGDLRLDEVGQLAQQFDAMADALQQNVYLLRDLVQTNANLVVKAEQSAIHAERNRLSRDLHDAIAQRLFSLTVSTSILPQTIQKDHEAGIVQAQAVAQLAEQTLLDLRTLLIDLRPAPIVEQGLMGALQKLCDEWSHIHGIKPDINAILSGNHLSHAIESTIYHIVQEGLSNVAKHAQATEVSISLVEGQHQIILSISDNGIGFSINNRLKQGHLGLISMQERAESMGGRFVIESETSKGTTIQVTLPIFPNIENQKSN